MNENYRRLPARFELETRFEIKPRPSIPFRLEHQDGLERLKSRLLQERLNAVRDPESNGLLRRAANEAASLAWTTAYPLLVFPLLFAEKADEGALRSGRQADVRARSRELLAV